MKSPQGTKYDYFLPTSGELFAELYQEGYSPRIVTISPHIKYVVVFDTCGTIYCEQFEYEIQQGLSYVANHSECPHFRFKENVLITFLPHLRILFDYLLSQDVRIVFFTSIHTAWEKGAANIIPKLLKSLWGDEKYERLESQGHFLTYSGGDRSYPKWNSRHVDKTRLVKNLKKVIQDNETLSNTILVDSNPLSCAFYQEPIILVRTFYPGTGQDYTRLNSVYYMLGLLKTYFEDERYRELRMSDAFTQILPAYVRWDKSLPEWYVRFDHDHPFVHEMMNVGLSAVREEVPNAKLYKRFGPHWGRSV